MRQLRSDGRVVEPLKDFHKDEVRALGNLRVIGKMAFLEVIPTFSVVCKFPKIILTSERLSESKAHFFSFFCDKRGEEGLAPYSVDT